MITAAIARAALLAGTVAVVSYASTVGAALYKCTGADGKVAYQDAPCPASTSEQALKAKAPPPAPAPQKAAAVAGKPAPKPAHDAAASAKPPKSVDVNVRTDRDRKPGDAAAQPYPAAPK